MKLSWVLGFGALLCAVLLAACSGNSPVGTAKAFYAALNQGNTEQVVDMVSVGKLDSTGEMSMARSKMEVAVRRMEQQFKSAHGLRGVDIKKVEQFDADHAVVHSVLHFGDGSSVDDTVNLVREQGRWKISTG